MLALIRRIPSAFDDVKAGNWNREAWQGAELHGKILGIIGFGRVGRQIFKIAPAFGMKVIWYDHALPCPWEFEEVLRSADIITVHVPLDVTTVGLFGTNEFQQMKPTAFFINTSRGQVVEEEALLHALINKEIAGVALDVVCNEPNISQKLTEYAKTHSNLILTCHIGGNTVESREKTQTFLASKIIDSLGKLKPT